MSSRDAYGFAQLQPVPASMGLVSQAGLTTMQAKAASGGAARLASERAVVRRDVLKARKGIPLLMRPVAWSWLGAAAAKRAAAPFSFHQLAACCDRVPDDVLYAIEEDCRTMYAFRQNPLFASARGIEALSRLLLAFAQRNPQCGYARGHMAHLAALLLAVYGLHDSEAAFWSFCALYEDRMFGYCAGQVLCGIRVEQRVLERLVAKKLPRVYDHLQKLGLALTTITQGWFSSCFVTVLPAETAARVIDSVMAEGNKVMQRIALALLKRHEAAIISCACGDNLRRVLEARITRATEADALMQVAFRGVGSLSGAQVNAYRDLEWRLVATELAEAKERHSARLVYMCSASTSLATGSSSGRSE